MDFEILTSEEIFKGRVFDVLRQQVRYPDGRVADFEFVSHNGAVTLVPIEEDGNIWLVRQYRHPTGGLLLELPAGTLEKGETPMQCASREVREEIGRAAGELRNLGEFFLAPGYSSEYMYVFLATQLALDPLLPDVDEYLEAELHSVVEVWKMVENGEIRDAKTIAALSLARPFFKTG
ncbi:MAG: NUDIX hydrolase [Chloroflexi bacterium]|nr:NUDIX hydrolase [Chloroflexota bacterium]